MISTRDNTYGLYETHDYVPTLQNINSVRIDPPNSRANNLTMRSITMDTYDRNRRPDVFIDTNHLGTQNTDEVKLLVAPIVNQMSEPSNKISAKTRWNRALHSVRSLHAIAEVRDFLVRGKRLPTKSETIANIQAAEDSPSTMQFGIANDTQFNFKTVNASPAFALSIPQAGEWKIPSSLELKEALSNASPLFKKHFATNTQAANQWIDKLSQSIKEKKMGADHKGIELYIRFKLAYYNMIHHLAYGTMWRTHEGKLKVAFLHQESVDPAHGSRTHTGRFMKNFDSEHLLHTAAINKKIAAGESMTELQLNKLLSTKSPVDQSLTMVGLPDVNVFPAKYPNLLTPITDALCQPDTAHPYGLFEGYSDRLVDKPDVQHINCFATTEMASKAVQGGKFGYPNDDVVPHCVTRLAHLTCTDVDKGFKEIEIKGTKRQLGDIAEDPIFGRKMALHLGRYWGENSAWDVTGQTLTKKN